MLISEHVMKFIFFTKTMYSETPRIRHQLADLLVSYGHNVVFTQRPLFFFEDSRNLENYNINNKVEIKQTKQLIHHQLRIFRWLVALNSNYETRQILSVFDNIDQDDIIINFNYDYVFLRRIFKYNKIITMINDDFVAQARFNNGRYVVESLSKVSMLSNAVLTVSYPLLNQVCSYNKRVELFLPWTENSYTNPVIKKRDSILVWASINSVIDFEIIKKLCFFYNKYKIYLVGPMDDKVKVIVTELLNTSVNLFYLEPQGLHELDNIADFFVGLMPYKSGVKSTEAVTAANKTFRLMSLGLPLIVHGMPSFYEHEAIFKCSSIDEIEKSIEYCHANYYEMQPSIEKLVSEQQPAQRYAQIMSIINEE